MRDLKEYKILLVDDEEEILKMVEDFLRSEGFSRIYTSNSYSKAVNIIENIKPDCAILDVMLPDGDGFQLLNKIRVNSQIPVLFLTAKDEIEDRLLGLGLGADDYIVKPFIPKELVLRLTAILKRVYFPIMEEEKRKAVFYMGNRKIDLNSGIVSYEGKELTLTAKEYMLLEKLYDNVGKIVTLDSLCKVAWGDTLYGYENTLMVHIRRLREKVEETPSKPRYLQTVRGLGYKLVMEYE